jgi:hypothetical protein
LIMAISRRTSFGVGELCTRISNGFKLFFMANHFFSEHSHSTKTASVQQAAFSVNWLGNYPICHTPLGSDSVPVLSRLAPCLQKVLGGIFNGEIGRAFFATVSATAKS